MPIIDQLNLGLRNFELDIFNDPQGGRFYNRLGNVLVGKKKRFLESYYGRCIGFSL